MKRTGPTKSAKVALVRVLRKQGTQSQQAIWKKIADTLESPRRNAHSVNVGKLTLLSKRLGKKTLLVAGKVLSGGMMEEPVEVVAFEYSQAAAEKIAKAKGKALLISEWVHSKPKLENVVLVK
ncbi:MAG: 50S ribosomal protein L18e [Candidatus Diapherotrites archaeon]|nr:50S ribosomal protein L18e [Candidatus Diapherotrites archaeon]